MNFNADNKKLEEILALLKLKEEDLHKYSDLFVPYLYLDGHRTSCVGENEIDQYKSGFDFFIRFAEILGSLGFKQLITMVHTYRNLQVDGRIEAVKTATQESVAYKPHHLNNSNIDFYGNLELYKEIGLNDFYEFLKSYSINSSENNFHHHILINYSEDWAINNLDKLSRMPNISSIIRFTKGHMSGGWIPTKMQKSTFVYSQVPSVSEFWSDEGILSLILIAFDNWLKTEKYIGSKSYNREEKEEIHNIRDNDLTFTKIKVETNSPIYNRVIIFSPTGPIEYEIK